MKTITISDKGTFASYSNGFAVSTVDEKSNTKYTVASMPEGFHIWLSCPAEIIEDSADKGGSVFSFSAINENAKNSSIEIMLTLEDIIEIGAMLNNMYIIEVKNKDDPYPTVLEVTNRGTEIAHPQDIVYPITHRSPDSIFVLVLHEMSKFELGKQRLDVCYNSRYSTDPVPVISLDCALLQRFVEMFDVAEHEAMVLLTGDY